ncbi:MAG: GDSL-type esterase/lipase family protein, partial [Thiobacillaceae bacterium]|nr:GDSL-type esterase/lipase family protein [Thiobacillaceae bacterium]
MRIRFFFLVLLFLLGGGVRAETVILVYGDSLSAAYGIAREAGWANLLARRLAERHPGHRVVNASVSGETTAGGLTRLPEVLAAHRPAITILALGANDGLRGLPP